MVPPAFNSNLAEIAYWLTPQLDANGNHELSDRESAFPQLLYTLRRRQRLVWPFNEAPFPAVPTHTPPANDLRNDAGYPYAELSVPTPPNPPPATVEVNRMNTVFAPPYRMGMQMGPPGDGPLPVTDPTYAGQFIPRGAGQPLLADYTDKRVDDVIATDVLSFDIQILLAGNTEFVHLDHPSVRLYSGWLNDPNPAQQSRFCNRAYPWRSDAGPYVFDTWSAERVGRYAYGGTNAAAPAWSQPGTFATIPLFRRRNNAGQYIGPPIRILAIKVTLRIWDPKTTLTRQTTMIQDL
jgi:hypothetical protein